VTDEAARMISKTIVGSPLVKTALFGKDPNWGRILCAVGYSGQPIDPATVSIALADIPVFVQGIPVAFDETIMQEQLAENEVKVAVELKEGAGVGTAWGCDLTYDYVKINALYHT
jgi:glutamate N-acetyltransferase/amino-acid N-acetyltransferase